LRSTYRLIRDFVTKEERKTLVEWIDGLQEIASLPNHHLEHLSKKVKGKSIIFDISNSGITNYITKFQSISAVCHETVPPVILSIFDRIAAHLDLPKDHIFLQAVDMSKGGKIDPHYDASVDGYINYKCNISVESKDYEINIDRHRVPIQEGDLYCFEASLYKHWTEEFSSRRVFLSCGFMLKYEKLGRSIDDPQVRLSRRIAKYFQ